MDYNGNIDGHDKLLNYITTIINEHKRFNFDTKLFDIILFFY